MPIFTEEFTPTNLLDNAGTASQNLTLVDDPVTRGAVLRSIYQWLDLQHYNIEDAKQELRMHSEFNN